MNDFEKIVETLKNKNETISTMESCTGGALVNEITNVKGSSEILKFSAVTYSNEFKIKMGIKPETIEKYSVYSINVAKEMSKSISDYTNSTYGIGITGRLNCKDTNNMGGNESIVYVSIYNRKQDKYTTMTIEAIKNNRKENKDIVIKQIKEILKTIIN